MTKSPDQAITFLHCWHSGNAASSHSRIFLQFRCHFKNLWYSPTLIARSILGPSMYGMNMLRTGCGCLGWWNVISGSGSCSELDCSSWLLVCISLGGFRSGSLGRTPGCCRHSGSLFRMIGTLPKYTITDFLEQAAQKMGISALCNVGMWKSLN